MAQRRRPGGTARAVSFSRKFPAEAGAGLTISYNSQRTEFPVPLSPQLPVKWTLRRFLVQQFMCCLSHHAFMFASAPEVHSLQDYLPYSVFEMEKRSLQTK